MTQEEKGKTYALHKASEKLHDYYGSAMLNVVQFDGNDIKCAYIDGYLQAEQDLEAKDVDLELNSFDATVCKIGSTYLKEMDREAIAKALEPYKDGDKVKVIIKAQKGD